MIDAHIHLSGSDLHPETLREGDRLGVRLFVGSSLCNFILYPSLEQVRRSNEDMAEVVRRHPDRVAGYCYVNPRHGAKALTDFRRFIEDRGLIGLKLWVATFCNNPLVFPFVEWAISYNLPILIHSFQKAIGQLPYESTAEHVADLACRYPEARIIMAHLGGQVERAMNRIASCSNVYTDTSGTLIGGNEVALAVQRLGARRVLFGSDLGGACLASNLGKVLGARLSLEDFDLVTRGNMERLLAEVRQ